MSNKRINLSYFILFYDLDDTHTMQFAYHLLRYERVIFMSEPPPPLFITFRWWYNTNFYRFYFFPKRLYLIVSCLYRTCYTTRKTSTGVHGNENSNTKRVLFLPIFIMRFYVTQYNNDCSERRRRWNLRVHVMINVTKHLCRYLRYGSYTQFWMLLFSEEKFFVSLFVHA